MKRFIDAQKENYDIALNEIKAGKKKSHYMWYIFPQLKGLGKSYLAEYYGLDGIEEVKVYCNNDYLYKFGISFDDMMEQSGIDVDELLENY